MNNTRNITKVSLWGGLIFVLISTSMADSLIGDTKEIDSFIKNNPGSPVGYHKKALFILDFLENYVIHDFRKLGNCSVHRRAKDHFRCYKALNYFLDNIILLQVKMCMCHKTSVILQRNSKTFDSKIFLEIHRMESSINNLETSLEQITSRFGTINSFDSRSYYDKTHVKCFYSNFDKMFDDKTNMLNCKKYGLG